MLQSFYKKNSIEAGIDEAGRGCYAGSVFAAAVILPKDFYHPLINDSKKLSEAQRDLLAPIIKDAAILKRAREIAFRILNEDPNLKKDKNLSINKAFTEITKNNNKIGKCPLW